MAANVRQHAEHAEDLACHRLLTVVEFVELSQPYLQTVQRLLRPCWMSQRLVQCVKGDVMQRQRHQAADDAAACGRLADAEHDQRRVRGLLRIMRASSPTANIAW